MVSFMHGIKPVSHPLKDKGWTLIPPPLPNILSIPSRILNSLITYHANMFNMESESQNRLYVYNWTSQSGSKKCVCPSLVFIWSCKDIKNIIWWQICWTANVNFHTYVNYRHQNILHYLISHRFGLVAIFEKVCAANCMLMKTVFIVVLLRANMLKIWNLTKTKQTESLVELKYIFLTMIIQIK